MWGQNLRFGPVDDREKLAVIKRFDYRVGMKHDDH